MLYFSFNCNSIFKIYKNPISKAVQTKENCQLTQEEMAAKQVKELCQHFMSNFFNMCKYDVWKHEFALAAMSSTGGRTVALPQLLAVCGSLSAAFTDSLSMVHSLKADVKPIIRLQWYHIFIVEFIFLLSGGGVGAVSEMPVASTN